MRLLIFWSGKEQLETKEGKTRSLSRNPNVTQNLSNVLRNDVKQLKMAAGRDLKAKYSILNGRYSLFS